MSYLLIILIVAAVVGVVMWAMSAARAGRPQEPDEANRDLTSTDVKPPPHPDSAVPGSDQARQEKGQP